MKETVNSLWLVPDKSDEQYLSNIINRLADGFDTPSFTPHLTLLGDINTTPEELINVVNDVFANEKKFTVELEKLNQSEEFTKTVYAEIKLNDALKRLFESVSAKTDNRGADNFKPHISLIYKLMPEKDKLQIIEGLAIKDSFLIGKAVVVDNKKKTEKEEDVQNWEIIYERQLNN